MMPRDGTPHSDTAASLMGDVIFGISQLVKGEFALMRAEAQNSLHDATSAIVKLVVAAVLGIVALNLLAAAIVAALVAGGLSPPWASAAVGLVLLLIAFAMTRLALPLLAASNLVPKRSFANLRQDAEVLKSMVNPHATSDIRP